MHFPVFRLLHAPVSFLLAVLVPWQLSTPLASNHMSQASQTLHELFRTEWDYQMEQNPTRASQLGDRRWNDRWPDLSISAINQRHQHNLDVLKKLAAIDRNGLSPGDLVNYDLFKKGYDNDVEEHRFGWHLIPLTMQGGVHSADELGDALRFDTAKDYEDWIARLRSLPGHIDQNIALMREGLRARMLLPKVIMQRLAGQIDKQIVTDPGASRFYNPFTRMPESVAGSEQTRLQNAAKDVISSTVVPAYKSLKQFFDSEYIPACFEKVGISQVPNGQDLYAYFARKYTTTDLTPKEIHEMGLREVKRIRSEMDAIIKKTGFKGTFAEFIAFLRTDPRFYYKKPEDLLLAYRAMSKEIDPHLVKVFGTLPRIPYGVEPIPDKIAPDTTTAYYREPAADGSRPGTYFVNLYKPETRPKYEMMALSLHEAVPGHHLQIALAMEQGEMPSFRRYGGYTAFTEGWGLYAESLGEEMGLYEDPYSKFGQLTYEMWRAVRLVVDTGMHSFGWDRQRAINFFLENAAKQELDIINEIDRYISWPGQALAYKIGELKIKELRARSSRTLGDRFDLREFHDVILKPGAVTLDILERSVEQWIKSKS